MPHAWRLVGSAVDGGCWVAAAAAAAHGAPRRKRLTHTGRSSGPGSGLEASLQVPYRASARAELPTAGSRSPYLGGEKTSPRPHVLATAHNHLRVPDNEGDDWLALPRVTGFATGNSRWSVVVAITKKFPLDFPSSHRPHHAVPLPPVCSRDLSSSSVRCSSPQKAADADARGTRSWRR